MVQIVDGGGSKLSRFLQHASPGIDSTIDRFLDRQKDQRKMAAEKEALERKIDQQKATAKALGLPEVAMEPSVMAALLKEKEKEKRNNQLLQALGITSPTENPFQSFMQGDDLMGEEPETQGAAGGLGGERIDPSLPRAGTPREFSDEQIAGLSLVNPQIANLLQSQKDERKKADAEKEKTLRKQFETDREFEWKRAGDLLKKNDEIRDSLEEKRSAANIIKQTAASEDTSGWGQYFADVLGLEPLRSADAALLKTATKDFFINNLAKAGSRPNQWIEQQISDAMVKMGRSKEANMVVAELMDYWVDREAEKVRLVDEIEDEDLAEHGFVKGDIGKRASQRMKQWEDKRRDQLMYQIQQTKESQNPQELETIKEVPKGTPLTREKALVFKKRYGADAEKAARNAGYDVEIFARIS